MWDESFYAVSAFEMATDGHWFVKYFDNEVDTHNLKPPLMTWIQALSFKTFGFNELSLRIPSALSGLLCAIILMGFLLKTVKRPEWGFLAALVLATSEGFIMDHVCRTGDYDATLTFFLFLSALSFYQWTEKPNNFKQIYLAALFTILAVFTKGIAGLLLLPGMLIFLLIKKQITLLFTSKAFYTSIALTVLLIGGYYYFRELLAPGYLKSIMSYETIGRFMHVQDGHQHPFSYYIKLLWSLQFRPWLILIPITLLYVFILRKKEHYAFFIYILILILTYLLIVSLAASKLEWYTAPLFPYLSIMAAYPLFIFFENVILKFKIKGQFSVLLIFIFFSTLIFYFPYREIIKRVYWPETSWASIKYGSFLKKLHKNHPDIKEFTILEDGWNSHALFYRMLYNEKKGYCINYSITFRNPELLGKKFRDLTYGDTVMAYQYEILNHLKHKYDLQIIDRYDELELVTLNHKNTKSQN